MLRKGHGDLYKAPTKKESVPRKGNFHRMYNAIIQDGTSVTRRSQRLVRVRYSASQRFLLGRCIWKAAQLLGDNFLGSYELFSLPFAMPGKGCALSIATEMHLDGIPAEHLMRF